MALVPPIFPLWVAWENWKKHAEDKGTLPTTQEERDDFFVFSPFSRIEDATPEMLIAALVAVKVAKQPKGLETLKALGVEYLKTIGKIMTALEGASTSNWLNCWINQKLSLRVCRRMGLITGHDAASLESSYNMMFNVVMAKEAIVDTITALGSFTHIVGTVGGATLK